MLSAPKKMHKKTSVIFLGLRGFPNVQGGVETHVQNLCTSLAALGCDVEVIVRPRYQSSNIGSTWQGIRFKRIWAPRSKSLESIVHTFLGILYAAVKRPDILHIHAIGPALLTPLARVLGLKVVVTHHGPDYDRQKWGRAARTTLRLGEQFGMKFANRRIAISGVIAALVREKYACDSVLIPNGVNLPDLPKSFSTLDRFCLETGKYVLLVGRMVPEKRHHDLIAAFIHASVNGWKLVLVGAPDHPNSYSQSITTLAAGTEGVVCTGFQSGTDLSELYANAGVFVLPSSHEGLPIAILEALSYGLPVIASDIPANAEITDCGISFYKMGDIHALADLLHRMAKISPHQERGETVRRHVTYKYNWGVIADQTHKVYADLLRGR